MKWQATVSGETRSRRPIHALDLLNPSESTPRSAWQSVERGLPVAPALSARAPVSLPMAE